MTFEVRGNYHDVLGVEMHPWSRSVQSVQESHTLYIPKQKIIIYFTNFVYQRKIIYLGHINGKFESQCTVQHNVAPLMEILVEGSQWHELCDNNQIWWGGAAANDWHNIGIGEDPENI